MNGKEERIRSFFRAYEQRFNDTLKEPPVVDIQGLVDCFAKFFVAADPNGVRGGRNGLAFRRATPHGFEFYRKIGTRSMGVTGLEIIPSATISISSPRSAGTRATPGRTARRCASISSTPTSCASRTRSRRSSAT